MLKLYIQSVLLCPEIDLNVADELQWDDPYWICSKN